MNQSFFAPFASQLVTAPAPFGFAAVLSSGMPLPNLDFYMQTVERSELVSQVETIATLLIVPR
jgi:hypothetical protein